MAESISWVATVATIIAAFMTASNLGSRVTGLGFAVFTVGALCWTTTGIITHQPALLWANVVLTVLDIFGVWRWLGRQAKVEEGARAAAEASEETPGEALFPVSLLARAPVRCGPTEVGRCIDAMASCRSGQLDYVVVSRGIQPIRGATTRSMAGALIVTAELGAEDFAWLERLRRAHYPPGRNQVAVHFTMFHALPLSAEGELRSRLKQMAAQRPPPARIEGLMDLGGGVAFRVTSPDLDRIRDELATGLHGLLSAPDSGGWRPHITVQNKVPPKTARALIQSLERDFHPRSLAIHGLGVHRYLGGPWERIAVYPFRA